VRRSTVTAAYAHPGTRQEAEVALERATHRFLRLPLGDGRSADRLDRNRRRGSQAPRPLPRWNSTYLVWCLALVAALATSLAAALLDLGGDAVTLVVDVAAVALVVNAVRWDVAIWRALNAPSEGAL